MGHLPHQRIANQTYHSIPEHLRLYAQAQTEEAQSQTRHPRSEQTSQFCQGIDFTGSHQAAKLRPHCHRLKTDIQAQAASELRPKSLGSTMMSHPSSDQAATTSDQTFKIRPDMPAQTRNPQTRAEIQTQTGWCQTEHPRLDQTASDRMAPDSSSWLRQPRPQTRHQN